MKRIITAFLLAFLSLGNALAQQISGKVVDETGQPLGFATIKIRTLPDSVTVAGGVSLEDGTFKLDLEDHNFPLILEASLIGYTTDQKKINNLTGHTLTLSENAIMLEEAVVTAQKIPHKLVPGGISTEISNSPLAQLPDLFSVLRGIPMLEIEGETIKVTGKESPIIYLNDRLLTDNNELKLIKPYLIERIEVITNPGSRYSASTQAVLKIYTRREPGSGLSGYLYGHIQHQPTAQRLSGYPYINLNYRKDHWDVFTTVYVSRNARANNNPYLKFEGRTEESQWENESKFDFNWKGADLGITLGSNYTDDNQSFGVKYSLYGSQSTSYGLNDMISKIQGFDTKHYLTENITVGKWNYAHRPSLYYLRNLGEWKAQIDADFYANSGTHETQHIREGHTEAYELRELESSNGASYKSFGTRFNLEGPLWDGQLGIGADYSYARNKFFNYNDKELNLPDLESSQNEQIIALFLEYYRNIGENWQVSGGLRLEHLNSEYFNQETKNEEQSRKYTNLFPTLSIGGRIGTLNTQLSFRSNINRPDYWRLQPQYMYISRFEYQVGNPALRSNINYSTQLMLNKSWFTFTTSYIYLVDDWAQRTSLMPDFKNPGQYLPNTLVMEQYNAKPYHILDVAMILSPTIGIWKPTFTAQIKKMIGYDVWDFDQLITNRKPYVQLSLNNLLDLPHDIKVTLIASLTPMGSLENMELVKPIYSTYFQISKQWLKEKQLTTSITTNNMLKNDGSTIKQMNRYSQLITRQEFMSYVRFTVSYRFNSTHDKYQGSGALDSVIGRM